MIKNKYKNCYIFWRSYIVFAGFLAIFLIGLLSPLSTNAATADIARWYGSDQGLKEGQIVSINSEKVEYVMPAKSDAKVKLLGVVVPDDQALLSVNKLEGGVQVAVAGRAQALVNASNGPISRGDLVGLSEFEGVGSKAKPGQPVIGVAESSFGEEGNGQSTESGLIAVLVSVGVAPSDVGSNATNQTTWLRSVAGNNVSALQLAFVFFIAIIGFISITTLSYSSTRNGLIAIGRNPMAKPEIFRGLAQSMIMVSLIAITAFSLMYFMLRL